MRPAFEPKRHPPLDEHILILGGSMTGLAAAIALRAPGRRITVVDRESLPECASPLEAFERWDRRGAPQTRHSHAFLARLHNLIAERVPDLYASLLEHGAETIDFADIVRENWGSDIVCDEDDEIRLLACRRITFDWVLQQYVDTLDGIDRRRGVHVAGLLTEPADEGRKRGTGVALHADSGGGVIEADLVIDAMGRNSRLERWLEDAGAAPMTKESEPCGIFYCSRFYRIKPGAKRPAQGGPIAGDLGFMKYAIFQGDSDIFSVTLAASPDDDALRRFRDADVFHTVASHLPSTKAWLEPSASEPITDVSVYANLRNTRRHFVEDGEPRAVVLFPIGDALLHALARTLGLPESHFDEAFRAAERFTSCTWPAVLMS